MNSANGANRPSPGHSGVPSDRSSSLGWNGLGKRSQTRKNRAEQAAEKLPCRRFVKGHDFTACGKTC